MSALAGHEGSDGYGWRKVNGKPMSMHRWVMAQVIGRNLTSREIVLHACDNPLCFRADHLSLGTVKANNDDMRAKGRDSKPPVNVFHGECHPMAKLEAWQVRRIRGHRQSGLSVKTIAAMFDISPSTVRRICNGQSWAQFGDHRPKPPTRDLLAEARERLVEWEEPPASAAERAEPPKRIRPVKHLTITQQQGTTDAPNHEYPTARLIYEREAGLLVCHCRAPAARAAAAVEVHAVRPLWPSGALVSAWTQMTLFDASGQVPRPPGWQMIGNREGNQGFHVVDHTTPDRSVVTVCGVVGRVITTNTYVIAPCATCQAATP